MACPFFLPTEKFTEGAWPHPQRLPLGDGWRGMCTAPGHENCAPTDAELIDFCNLGYPKGCRWFPQARHADSIRLSVARDTGDTIEICYVCEREHRPREYGILHYHALSGSWPLPHRDQRIQRMAVCYIDSYLARKHTCDPPCTP